MKKMKKALSLILTIVLLCGMSESVQAEEQTEEQTDDPLAYCVQLSDGRWTESVGENTTAGEPDSGQYLTAIKAEVTDADENREISYRVSDAKDSWSEWCSDGKETAAMEQGIKAFEQDDAFAETVAGRSGCQRDHETGGR